MNNTMLQNACSSKEAYPGHNCAIEILETDLQSLEGSDRIKLQQTAEKSLNSDLKTMNNTEANGLQNANFSKISVPGLI